MIERKPCIRCGDKFGTPYTKNQDLPIRVGGRCKSCHGKHETEVKNRYMGKPVREYQANLRPNRGSEKEGDGMTSFWVGDTVIYTPANGKPVKSVVTLTPSAWRRQGGFIGIRGVGKVRASQCRLADEMPESPLMQRASGKWITAADILPALTEANK